MQNVQIGINARWSVELKAEQPAQSQQLQSPLSQFRRWGMEAFDHIRWKKIVITD